MVRVLIERRFVSGLEVELNKTLVAVRREASLTPGYVCGETLINTEDPQHFLVISTWRSREAWESWRGSESRATQLSALMAFMIEPEKVTVFEHA